MILRFIFQKRSLFVCTFLFLTFFAFLSQITNIANAETYHVGSGQDYATLEVLRQAKLGNWSGDNEIILYGDDNSLNTYFNFGSANITLSGTGNITGNGLLRFVYMSGTFTIADGSEITIDHFSGSVGGAIASSGDVTISGNNTFTNNSAEQPGGAIYSAGDIIISGNSTFTNNMSQYGDGGAIYASQNVFITADGGDIIFAGNTANGTPNAIYLVNINNNTLSLGATEGNSVQFFDPITSRSGAALTIDINKDDNNTGTVLFDMSNNPAAAGKTSAIYGNTTVYNGTLALKGGTVYGASVNNGNFSLKKDATLSVAGSGNAINAGTGTVRLDGTLAFDLTGAANGSTLLTINNSAGGTVTGTPKEIDIVSFGNVTGDTFNLIGGGTGLDLSGTPIKTHGENIAKTRANGTTIDSNQTLQLSATAQNGTVTWTGHESNVWNASDDNWIGNIGGSEVTKFLHGDAVIFDLTGDHVITIQDGGVTVKSMTVQGGGEWTFTGGEIVGGEIAIDGTNTTLLFDTRSMNQRITVANGATATVAPTENSKLTFNGFTNIDRGGAISANDGSHLTIGAAGAEVLFNANSSVGYGGAIYSRGDVTIYDSTFSNNIAASGGAIYAYNGVTINDTSTFSNNEATINGGAIYARNGVTINDISTFSNNNAEQGGAIYARNGVIINDTSTFSNNNATNYGGAIYAEYGDVDISGTSTFSNNKATNASGGAIYAYDGDVIIDGTSTFSNNKATIYGGAIFTNNDVVFSGTSTFSNNIANFGGAIAAQNDVTISGTSTFSDNNATNYGGAIYAYSGDVTISGTSTFSDNIAAGGPGGAIFASYGDVKISGTSTFSNNTANFDSGGAIDARNDVTISGTSMFSNNKATNGYGGAIYTYSGDVKIDGTSMFSNNTATYGGAIYVNRNMTLTANDGNITFQGNKASSTPNAIYLYNSGNNKALSLSATAGNSILFYDPIESSSTNQTLTININGNSAIIEPQTGTVLFDGNNDGQHQSNIYGNTTVYNGTMVLQNGAIYGANANAGTFELQENATLSVKGKDNAIKASGNVTLNGTLAFDLTGVAASADTVLTTNSNTAVTRSAKGNIDIRSFNGSGTFNLIDTANGFDNSGNVFTEATLTMHGEAIANTRAEGKVSLALDDGTSKILQLTSGVINGTVTWNKPGDGNWNAIDENWQGSGAISGETQFLHGDDVVFNSAGDHVINVQDGGVTVKSMTVQGGGTWTFTNGEIDGGEIQFVDANDTKLLFDTRTINQRLTVAQNARGTIAPLAGKTLTFSGFTRDSSDGGAILTNTGSHLTIGATGAEVIFDANSADNGGGAIASLGDVTIYNSTFSNNTADDGGAIASGGAVEISGSMFTNNSAGNGGAIYGTGGVNISGSSFTNNTADDGGAIASGGAVEISGSTFTNNTANTYGGAIDSNGAVTISGNSSFINNTATSSSDGGAIFAWQNVSITADTGNIIFKGNKANDTPNAIYLENYNDYKTLSLAANGTNSVQFFDPITNRNYGTFTININSSSANTGTVLFDMSNNSGTGKESAIYGNTTISYGTLALKGEAVYGASGNNGTFNLKQDATLLSTGSGNEINAGSGSVTLNGKLAFDLTGYSADNALLTINGNGTISGTPSIDIRNVAQNGRYVLLTGNNLALTVPTTFTYFDENVTNTRAKSISIIDESTDKLVLKVDATNYDVTWNGSQNGNWNINDKNWSGTGSPTDSFGDPITQFLHNDNVTFGLTGAGAIAVNSGGVTVGTMKVTEDGYTFSNGKINGTILNLNSSGETTFKNEIDFASGITVAQNSTLVFDYTTDIANSNKISGLGDVKKIGNGSLVLTGDTSSATGTFTQNGGNVTLQNTWGGSYNQLANTILNLGSNAKIIGNADFAGKVNFDNKIETGGSLTYRNQDTTAPLDLTGTKSIDVGGTFELASGAAMDFEIASNKLKANEVKLDGEVNVIVTNLSQGNIDNVIVSTNQPLDRTRLDSIFNVAQKLLVNISAYYDDDFTMGISSSSQSAEDYTTQNGFSNNQSQIAGVLDELAQKNPQINTILSNLETREDLDALTVSLLTPELAADARDIPLTHPYYRVFNHVNNLFATTSSRNPGGSNLQNLPNVNTIYRGQNSSRQNSTRSEIWFEGYYRTENVYSDSNALGYKTSHGGMVVGIDEIFVNGLVSGVIFGYGNPRSHNQTGKIEADDYTFGVYSRLKISNLYANIFLGYGHQNYNLNNSVKYNGNSLYTSFEIFDRINLRNGILLMPLVGLDFQKAWSDGFSFNSNFGQISVGKGELEQMVLRVGVNSTYKNLRTRLQYGYQVAGDTHSTSRTTFSGTTSRTLAGVNLGRHTINIGIGGDRKIAKNINLFGDYDLDIGENSISHTGQIGVVKRF